MSFPIGLICLLCVITKNIIIIVTMIHKHFILALTRRKHVHVAEFSWKREKNNILFRYSFQQYFAIYPVSLNVLTMSNSSPSFFFSIFEFVDVNPSLDCNISIEDFFFCFLLVGGNIISTGNWDSL